MNYRCDERNVFTMIFKRARKRENELQMPWAKKVVATASSNGDSFGIFWIMKIISAHWNWRENSSLQRMSIWMYVYAWACLLKIYENCYDTLGFRQRMNELTRISHICVKIEIYRYVFF